MSMLRGTQHSHWTRLAAVLVVGAVVIGFGLRVERRYAMDAIPDLSGKVAVVTGANTGIGFVTAREMARRGARVVLACRDSKRGVDAMDRILDEIPDAQLDLVGLDLSSLASVREAAHGIRSMHRRVDVLVNNAGVMATPFRTTKDGIEQQWGVNHVGHFLFTVELLPALGAGSRVVVLSSLAHRHSYAEGVRLASINDQASYSPFSAYAQSKLGNLLFARRLHRLLSSRKVLVNAVHPGFVATDLFRGVSELPVIGPLASAAMPFICRLFALTPDEGALTSLYAATSPEVEEEGFSGKYFIPIGVQGTPSRAASSERLEAAVWEHTEKLVAKFMSEKTRNTLRALELAAGLNA